MLPAAVVSSRAGSVLPVSSRHNSEQPAAGPHPNTHHPSSPARPRHKRRVQPDLRQDPGQSHSAVARRHPRQGCWCAQGDEPSALHTADWRTGGWLQQGVWHCSEAAGVVQAAAGVITTGSVLPGPDWHRPLPQRVISGACRLEDVRFCWKPARWGQLLVRHAGGTQRHCVQLDISGVHCARWHRGRLQCGGDVRLGGGSSSCWAVRGAIRDGERKVPCWAAGAGRACLFTGYDCAIQGQDDGRF
mmetsp:Transcript_55860/g.116872  ORF Transcript_55860/g.116872 Transcript_55860/m.116872 type:complete len:245 (-) Transcript_55860:2016-2750(-)